MGAWDKIIIAYLANWNKKKTKEYKYKFELHYYDGI